jgi:hypothetical protein
MFVVGYVVGAMLEKNAPFFYVNEIVDWLINKLEKKFGD